MAPDQIDIDIDIAAAHGGCALITATADVAFRLAGEIVRRGGDASPAISLLDCDGADSAALRAAFGEASGVLLLADVHLLTAQSQTTLAGLIESLPDPHPARIMASSAERLFDRVQHGTFRSDLFYRLNTIHLVP